MQSALDGSDYPPDDGVEDGTRRRDVPRQGSARLTDAAIEAIAERVAQAVPLPAPDDQATWILARGAQLAADDDECVIRALARRTTDTRRGNGPQGGT